MSAISPLRTFQERMEKAPYRPLLYIEICFGLQKINEYAPIRYDISYEEYLDLHAALNQANRKDIDPLSREDFFRRIRKEGELFPLEINRGPLGTIFHNFPQMEELEWEPRRPRRWCTLF